MTLSLFVAGAAIGVGCDVDKTEDGELPEVDVEEGKLPKYDVDYPEVEVKTEKKEVEVPDIDVDVGSEKKQVEVPDIDVKAPDDEPEVDQAE